ncbi:enoyl-(Acyl carrier protein) reductase domain-containing protein [Phthorimaea operculella]|nr:enoyl-(Acyl carrier protein) reductase domain-containing protein [Phthorimaea operculella]
MTLLKNKVAIVTGASSGIGAAIAEKFAEEGAKVTMVGRNKDKLENVAKKLKAKGSQPLVLVGDVTNEHQCRQIVEKGVRVNAINPGPVGSDLYAAAADPAAVLERMRGATALGRTSDAEEIADLAVFLASEKARGMTGGTYVSDNGVLLSN